MSTPTQIIGGEFQDAAGVALALGYIQFTISHDEVVNGNTQVCAGIPVRMTLDSSGSVPASPVSQLWPNSVLLPTNSYYIVEAFTVSGAKAWAAPQLWIIPVSATPFDIGTLLPISPSPPSLSVATNLLVDGTPNVVQNTLNLSDQMMGFGEFIDRGDGTVVLFSDYPDSNWAQLTNGVSTTLINPFCLVPLDGNITSNVLTINFAPAQQGSWPINLSPGDFVWLNRFNSPYDYLNGTLITITTVDMLTGVLTAPFTHANDTFDPNALGGTVSVSFVGVVSYAGSTYTPPTTVSPASAPTNTGALWINIAPDYGTFTIESTNSLDNNWVNYFLVNLYF